MSTGKTVYVLGAGASHATEVSQDRPKAPLMNGFLGTAIDVIGREKCLTSLFSLILARYFGVSTRKLADQQLYTRLRALNIESFVTWSDTLRKLRHLEDTAPYLHSTAQDLEDQKFLTRLFDIMRDEYGLFMRDDRKRSLQRIAKNRGLLYDYLFRMIRAQCIYIVNELLSTILEDVLCPLHDRLVERLKPGDTVISFNYDLLIDQALDRSRMAWNYSSGYGVPANSLGWISLFGERLVTRESPAPAISLLKLHGSLNWWIVDLIPEDHYAPTNDGATLFVRDGALSRRTFDVVCSGGRYFRPWEKPWPVMVNEYDKKPLTVFEPFIALSTLDKDWLVKSPRTPNSFTVTTDIMWAEALRALVKATEVVLIGYSLPLGDYWFETLLREATIRGTIKRLVVVNPDTSVKKRAEFMCWTARLRHFASFQDYVVNG